MTTTEDRLRDTFVAIDRQITHVPPLLDVEPASTRPTARRVLAIAAALLAVVIGVGTFVTTRDDGDGVVAEERNGTEFKSGADAACRTMYSDLADAVLQFVTPEAYELVAPRRAAALATMRSAIASLPDAAGDAGLRMRVVDLLERAVSDFESSGRAGSAGDVDLAGRRWANGHERQLAAMGLLSQHGAEACR
jgi:hypothetical protein